jgi:cytoskeletal protein CcmA (bactofilin family)
MRIRPVLKEQDGRVGTNPEGDIAFLAQGVEFEGIIKYDGTLRIDGRVKGEIITEGTLVLGETAVMDAEINAGNVISAGKINGNVTAVSTVHLYASAVLNGSVRTSILMIEEGAMLNGNCKMDKVEGCLETDVPSGDPHSELLGDRQQQRFEVTVQEQNKDDSRDGWQRI